MDLVEKKIAIVDAAAVRATFRAKRLEWMAVTVTACSDIDIRRMSENMHRRHLTARITS